MGQRNQFDIEGPHVETARKRYLGDDRLLVQVHFLQLSAQDAGRERGRVNRTFQPAPQIRHRADMVLMRMSQHKPRQLVGAFLDEGRVRHDDIDTRRFVVAERDPEVHHQPGIVMAEQVQVHADFTGAPQRQEQQLLPGRRPGLRIPLHAARFR